MENKGFTITVTSRYEGWWRYNAALMCGCFDAAGERTDFVSAESHVADAGANLAERPAEVAPERKATLETPPCDHLLLYIYIVPHTLPAGNDIDDTQPFDLDIAIAFNGRELQKQRRKINQWSGASIEMRVEKE